MSLEISVLLQDVVSFLLCGAVVGPKQSLSVSVATDGTHLEFLLLLCSLGVMDCLHTCLVGTW